MNKTVNRIKELREIKGLSQTELAEQCDTTLRMIQYLEKGERQLTQKWLGILAAALNVSPAEIIQDIVPIRTNNPMNFIPVIGEVKAGTWIEAFPYDPDHHDVLPFYDEEHPNSYALKVAGDSMNLHYPEGSYVLVIPNVDINTPPKSGDHVIVERKRKDGIFEATIKELMIDGKTAQLAPRSTNPKHQPIPITPPFDKDHVVGIETITITGIVIGSYMKRKR